jgi:Flp pilus assembly protein TadB
MIPTTPEAWVQRGPVFALLGIVLAIAALGWDPALRALTVPEPPPSHFVFQPKVLAPALLLVILMATGSVIILIATIHAGAGLLLTTPLVLIGVGRAALALARHRYQRRLQRQLLLAIEQLAAMTSGSAAVLSAFRAVGRASPWPLCAEWAWVDRHVSIPYVMVEGTRRLTRHSDHAYALRALALQTPLELHARVLDHLAAIYEQGAESHAPARLHQLAEVLAQQSSLQRDLITQLGRVRGEAFVIASAMGLIALWLLVSQTERVAMAFLVSPLGPLAAIWFVFWFALPIGVALLVTRTQELPL